MKDRMALAMIEAAEADGRLKHGGSVVEYTGGSTGVSLSLVCAVKRYPLDIVTSDAFTREKLDHMRLLGAKLRIVASEDGRMTEKLTRDMIEAARVTAAETGAFWTDQLNNGDQVAAYHKLAEEIWAETGGAVDGFVQGVGTAASLRGTGEALRRRNERIRITAVEPAESPVLSRGKAGAHKIDGIGVGFIPPLWRDGVADAIERVSTADATAMALRLARGEGVFAGTSTGANVVAALRLAEQLDAIDPCALRTDADGREGANARNQPPEIRRADACLLALQPRCSRMDGESDALRPRSCLTTSPSRRGRRSSRSGRPEN
jgi:cysteine synthase A